MFIGHALRLAVAGVTNAAQPALTLNLRAATLDSRLTFSRASASTDIINGQLTLFGNDAPRISLANGLLMEDSRTNLAFNNSFVVTTGLTVASAQPDPLGGTAAYLCVEDTTTAQHAAQSNTIAFTAAAYTVSAFIKPGTCNRVQMRVTSNVVANGHANFYLSDGGTVSLAGAGISASSIQALADGWYRVSMTFTSVGAQNSDIRFFSLLTGSEAGAPSVAGSSRSFTVYGCQAELGGSLSSYIPTTSMAATRAVESCTLALGSWYNEAEGTLLAEGLTAAGVDVAATHSRLVRIDNGGNAMVHEIRRNNPDNTGRMGTTTNSTAQSNFIGSNWPLGASLKAAYAYKLHDMAACQNAGSVQTDTASPDGMPSGMTVLRLGSAYNAGAFGGYVQQLRYWRTRLANDKLGALTS